MASQTTPVGNSANPFLFEFPHTMCKFLSSLSQSSVVAMVGTTRGW